MSLIYFDNNATTMVAPEAVEVMEPLLREHYGNPSSTHYFGQQVRHAVETAREQVASAIRCQPREIIFTSGGTEANDLAIRGVLADRADKRHIVTTTVEHHSVLRLAEQLENQGYDVTRVGVDQLGRIDPAQFEAALTDKTALASVMHANNETGVVFPIEPLAEIAAAKGVPLHVDAAQTVGKLPIDLDKAPVNLLTMSAHKFHGPKGVGAVFVRRGTRLQAQLVGGHQERSLRAGTENVAGIVGMGQALHLAVEHVSRENARIRAMRDRLEAGIVERVAIARPIGDRKARLPNTTNIGFEALEAEAILMLLSNHGLCASSGSACSSGSLESSHILAAMNIDEKVAHGAVRFSLSRFNTDDQVDRAIDIVSQVIERLRTVLPCAEPGR
jgi:cysteine desulfurase